MVSLLHRATINKRITRLRTQRTCFCVRNAKRDKNSSVDEIANVNFYAVRPEDTLEFTETTQNNAITPYKVIQGHRFWYQSKAHIRFPISD